MRTFSENKNLVSERREHVRKCATALFVKKPFEKASTQEILQATGMSKGGLYYYVGSKKDIRSLILDHAAKAHIETHRSLLQATERLSASDALREAIRVLCRWMNDYQDEIIVIVHEVGNLSKEEREPQLRSETMNVALVENLIRKGITSGEFKTDDPKIAAHTIYLGIHAWAERRWYLRKFYTLEQYIDSLSEFAISSLWKSNSPKKILANAAS